MREAIVLASFIGMGVLFASNFARARLRGESFLGMDPIHRVPYRLGKLSMFITWGALLAAVLGCRPCSGPGPEWLKWAGFAAFLAGSGLATAAAVKLGVSTRMGLSDSVEFRTGGVFRVSRNPMYVGFFLTSLAASLFAASPTLSPVLFGFTCFVVYSHHRVILAEEAFMSERYGSSWTEYAATVRRYL